MESKNQKNKNIHWFPGHMKKASIQIEDKIKLVDFVIVLLDARAVFSSFNPYLINLTKGKKKLFLITKKDLADDEVSKDWEKELNKNNDFVLFADFTNQKIINDINKLIDLMVEKEKEKALKKGIKNISLRAMVVGIPNVGKSTFINLMAKKAIADTANKAGLTRNLRWIKVNKNFELLDTPGILTPKFENHNIALNLALIGSINDDILPLEEMFNEFFEFIKKNYRKEFTTRYLLDINYNYTSEETLNEIGKKRGFLKKGNEIDIEKTIKVILTEFRSGKIGKISLERSRNVNF